MEKDDKDDGDDDNGDDDEGELFVEVKEERAHVSCSRLSSSFCLSASSLFRLSSSSFL